MNRRSATLENKGEMARTDVHFENKKEGRNDNYIITDVEHR